MDLENESHRFDETEFEDALYDALSVADRRQAVRTLTTERTPMSVEQLASELAAAKLSIPVDSVTSDQRAAVLTALVHVHLPKLLDVGLITWDVEAGTVDRSVLVRQLSASAPLSGGLFDAANQPCPPKHPKTV